MTRVAGVRILVARCCGQRYAVPNYLSMNFMAFEYWTDGWREHSLMPNDVGLRRCRCGRFLLLRELVQVATSDASDLPCIERVEHEDLSDCIAQADSDSLEVAARLEKWRALNHAYRVTYRKHREAEELAIKAAWEAANPDRRIWWNKFYAQKEKAFVLPVPRKFTFPEFVVTDEQSENMSRLSQILQSWVDGSRSTHSAELAELYRELGLFERAERVVSRLKYVGDNVRCRVIADLIRERQSAPLRYRM